MAKQTISTSLQTHIKRILNFLNYTKAYLKKTNPVKNFIAGIKTYFKNLLEIKPQLKKLKNRINYETYKLKKTELILAQNTEHVFLRGRSLNQIR